MWMRYFMAGFFIVFSFFKFLNLAGFAESYAMYDVLAKRVQAYGLVYPFLELFLGAAYLTNFEPTITYIATIFLMSFSSIGVIQSVLDKRKIRWTEAFHETREKARSKKLEKDKEIKEKSSDSTK